MTLNFIVLLGVETYWTYCKEEKKHRFAFLEHNLKRQSTMDLMYIPEDLSGCPKLGNKSCPPTHRPLQVRVLMYSIMTGATVTTIFGNLVIMISIWHFKQLHCSTDFLILSMATTDFFCWVASLCRTAWCGPWRELLALWVGLRQDAQPELHAPPLLRCCPLV